MISCIYPGGRIISCTFDELERKKANSGQNGLIANYDYTGPNRVEQREIMAIIPVVPTAMTASSASRERRI